MTKTIEFLTYRFACKHYLNRQVEEEKLKVILEAGRLSPSSFGLEPWCFHITRSCDILSECYYQESMKSAPITIVITVKKEKSFDPYSAFVKERASRFPDPLEVFIDDYKGYYEMLKREGRVDMWSRSQSYIAAANMMTAAAELGIESCAIEGYDNDRLISALGLDNAEDEVGIVIAFGYSAEEERPKIRETLESITVDHR